MLFMNSHCTAWQGDSACISCDGQENALFAGLNHRDVAALDVHIDNVSFSSGETIYRFGAPADTLLVIRTGAVKLLRYASNGAEQRIVRVVKPGEVIGLDAMLAGTMQYHAIAVGEVRGCRVPLSSVEVLCMKFPRFQWAVMRLLQSSQRETEQWLVDLTCGAGTARERMARLLLKLRVGDNDRIHNFSREDIRAMLGVTVETACRIMAEFSRLGLLVRNGKKRDPFCSANIAALERIAAGEPETGDEAGNRLADAWPLHAQGGEAGECSVTLTA